MGLLVDESGDTLDTTTAGQTMDGGLGDTLDVVSQKPSCASWHPPFRVPFLLTTARHCQMTENEMCELALTNQEWLLPATANPYIPLQARTFREPLQNVRTL